MSIRFNQRYQMLPEGYGQRFLDFGNEFFGLLYYDAQVYDWASGGIHGHFSIPGMAGSAYSYAVQQVPLGGNELVTSTWLSPMDASGGNTDFVLWKVSRTGSLAITRYDVVKSGARFVDYNPTFRQILAICSMGGRNFAAVFRSSDQATHIYLMRFSISESGALKITSNKKLAVSKTTVNIMNGGPNSFMWDAKLGRFVWFLQTMEGTNAWGWGYEYGRLMALNEKDGVTSDTSIKMGTVTGNSDAGYKFPFWSAPYLEGRELRFWNMDPAQPGAQRCSLNIDILSLQKGEPVGFNYFTWWAQWNQAFFFDPTRGQREIIAHYIGDGDYIVDPDSVGSSGGLRFSLPIEITEWDPGNEFSGPVKFGPASPGWPSRFFVSRDGRYAVYGDSVGYVPYPAIVLNRVVVQPKPGRGTKRAHFS